MVYYQNDFLSDKLAIEKQSVNLFISSPPLKVIDNQLSLLFEKISFFMDKKGFVLIDTPAGYNQRIINFYDIGMETGWKLSSHNHLIHSPYIDGKDQIFYLFQYEQRNISCPRYLEILPFKKKHSHEFNPFLIQILVQNYSETGDTVLDGFCGTGTVPKIAEKLNRKGIGVDIRPKENLCDISCKLE